jgi:hypothetical protein
MKRWHGCDATRNLTHEGMSELNVVKNLLTRHVPFLREKQTISREEALRMRTVHNAIVQWETSEDGEICLLVPRRSDVMARLLCRVFRAPSHKRITLDEVGSFVWGFCDGEHSVDSIVTETCKKYSVSRRECETSVSAFLKMLGDRNLVAFHSGGRRKK